MSWVKLDDRFLSNPKVIDLTKDAKLLYIAGLSHAAGQLTNGFLSKGAVRAMRGLVDAEGSAVGELVTANLWENADSGYQIHDYEKYNPSADDTIRRREELSRIRSEAGKKGMESRWRDNKDNKDITTHVIDSLYQTPLQNDNPVPVPVIVPVPDPVLDSTSKALATAPRKKPRGNGSPPDSALVWEAFQTAYNRRYGVEHPRNATVNAQMLNFIGRIGLAESPAVAAFYVGHNKAYYVQQRHTIGAMLRDAEALRTDWATGCKATNREANEADRMQGTSEMWDRIEARQQAKRTTVDT